MKVTLLVVGKTEKGPINDAINIYKDRLKHYIPFEMVELVVKKKGGEKEDFIKLEGTAILKMVKATDYVVLLDNSGKEYSSEAFARKIQSYANRGISNCIFIIGGAFGFHESVVARSSEKVSLSQMTFSHQMVRLFFTEQLYRGMTILKGESYHH
ncbi:MAG: 23S rRNA (pseudouridine(1915)-N(3))-methyltransferase RlmH [Flavobacteriales bacterium]|nr:23S rRNA (pseudouridine(1915)-N(3))-methyltransferase RlmH [Flavobacteriales bacterium]